MREAILGTLAAGVLAFGFACAGDVLLRRTSRSLFGWNESFLIGLGACAALLFPLSVVAPHGALGLELGILGASVLAAAWLRLRRRPDPEQERGNGDLEAIARDPVAVLLLAAILSVGLFFCAVNLWISHSWDSVQVWGAKAQLLFVQGGLPREWFPEESYDVRLLAYPQLISLFEAAFSRLRGVFDYDRLKPIFPYFFASLLLGTYAAVRTVCSRRWALAMVLLVALLPELLVGASAGGLVDMPLAAFVAAVVAAGLGSDEERPAWRSPLPWLIGALTTVKQEGMLLALIACGAIGLSWILERPRRLGLRLREHAGAAAVVLGFIAARVGYVRWIHVHDATWGPFDAEHRARALHSIGLVASLCLRQMLEPRTWGLFWPAFFVASALALTFRRTRLTPLVLSIAAAMVVEASVFLFTNWDVATHIEGAYSRLLAQLAPAAAVVIGAAGERLWSSEAGEPA